MPNGHLPDPRNQMEVNQYLMVTVSNIELVNNYQEQELKNHSKMLNKHSMLINCLDKDVSLLKKEFKIKSDNNKKMVVKDNPKQNMVKYIWSTLPLWVKVFMAFGGTLVAGILTYLSGAV